MKVALSVSNNLVTNHFGYCDYFIVYTVEDNKVVETEIIKNPPHQKGFLPSFLHDLGVDCIITGNMGEMAVNMFDDLNIKSYRGVEGEAAEVIEQFIQGKLKAQDVICNEHQHHHS
ncbi:MAG: NifB/NifX family molybdenum-iron cluster-binding protein [Bacilli bacterium]|nr:NifB/NifX family molybdenum-iron cluster-binding protein [Bacilli bacterium]MBN2696136.1 NifB/NifX family molybdenum-iron cluster-binding protein [Bacilli bacterium]